MSLRATRLRVSDFRSYETYEVELDPELTVIVGPNAVGKTNLIEAVQLLTATESFRRPQWTDTVRWGAQSAHLEIEAAGGTRHLLIELDIVAEGRREYRVNGKVRRRLSDVSGVLPSVVFTPDDLRMVKDSAQRRRETLDSLGSQLSPSYASLKKDYEKVVRQRNALLKDEALRGELATSFNEALLERGARFTEARQRLFARLATAMAEAHRGMAPSLELEPIYVASWERDGINTGEASAREALSNHLEAKQSEEIARRTTLVGPHRDEIVFLIDGRDARAFGSQGQQRTIALSWKLGEVMVTTDVLGQPPILLLDDVMSELDQDRRHALTRYVGTAAQTVVTTTHVGYFDEELLRRARVVDLVVER